MDVDGLLTINHASTAPSTAPMIAVLPDNSTLFASAANAADENSAPMRAREKAPSASSSLNALTITVTVGMSRKITTTAKNGSSGSVSRTRRERVLTGIRAVSRSPRPSCPSDTWWPSRSDRDSGP